MAKRLLRAGIAGVLLFSALSATAREIDVRKTNFTGAWPLLVDSGSLGCDLGAVYFRHTTGTYPVNGTAKAVAVNRGWFQLESIWKTDPTNPGARIPITDLLRAGMKLCAPA